jgi:hypothetical protein
MLKDWNFWCSMITALTAILALWLSVHQTALSNKQHLFDRRLKAYMLINGIAALWKREPQFANDDNFVWLTNNSYMESQADAIKHPLAQPFHKDFLRKREELRNTAMEVEVIFKGKEALVYGDFLRAYENALGKMYQYQIIIDKMQKESEKHAMTVEAAAKMFSEEQYRDKLYDALESLRKTYDIVTQDRMERQLKKQLELV